MLSQAIITIIGRLGRDAESATTPSGKSITRLSVGVSTGFGDKKHTDWFDVTSWFNIPDFIRNGLVKGAEVMVTGRFQKNTREYNGKNYESLSVNAYEISVDKPREAAQPKQPDLMDGDVPF